MARGRLGLAGLAVALLLTNVHGAQHADIAALVGQMTRDSVWRPVASIHVVGRVFHPQGMVKIGDDLYVSSVEVSEAPRRLDRVDAAGFDRTPGSGVGHLFRITGGGRIVVDVRLGEGAAYHPGGMDFDGQSLWVPVAEYRPNSRSIVYRVDPTTMRAVPVLRVSDHLGAVVVDPERQTLHGVNWGSRRFYQWPLPPGGSTAEPRVAPLQPRHDNPSHYVDYQDCKFAGRQRMVCTGLAEFGGEGDSSVQIGGLDLVSLVDARPLWQVPVTRRSATGRLLTQNPSYFEATRDGLLAYFMPDDDQATILVYRITP